MEVLKGQIKQSQAYAETVKLSLNDGDSMVFRLCLGLLFLTLAEMAAATNSVDDFEECEFRQRLYSDCEKCDYLPQEKLYASSTATKFWRITHAGIDLMIPVDDYRQVAFFPSENKERLDSMLLKADSHTVEITNHYDSGGKRYRLLELGVTAKASQIICSSLQAKHQAETLIGTSWKDTLFDGKPIYLSQLDESLNGWLFIGSKEIFGQGRKSQQHTWSTVYKPINKRFIEYKLIREGESNPLQLGGLLSQSRSTLKSTAELSPDWLLEIESALQGDFSEVKTLVVPALMGEGFSKVDTSGLSIIALER